MKMITLLLYWSNFKFEYSCLKTKKNMWLELILNNFFKMSSFEINIKRNTDNCL